MGSSVLAPREVHDRAGRIRRFLNLAALLVALPAAPLVRQTVAQAPARAIDVSGKWLFTVTSTAGTGTPTVTFKQAGDSLTGHYSSQTLGEVDFAGSIKADRITFGIKTEVQGTALTVTYSGTVESTDAMKGTVDFGGMASGTFTAKRQ
jgi:hypothetical protein